MYIENFWGGGVPPNTIMATLRGGGGIKVLKMYYVVCDWSLRIMTGQMNQKRSMGSKRDIREGVGDEGEKGIGRLKLP